MTTLRIADLFCGAGGTSTGAIQAAERLGYSVELTAVNHWPIAVETHSANHPGARHYCAAVDSLNPRHLYPDGRLNILLASPECTHHSRARGGRPMQDQSRATAWCVTRWADALRPDCIVVENVPEFEEWGPLSAAGKPLQTRKGETFRAWLTTLNSLGYVVDHRRLCAADYGVPTTRTRLFVQAVRGRRRIVWPDATHSAHSDLWGRPRWRPAADIIDWTIPTPTLTERKRPLAPKTMARIREGLRRYAGNPFIIAMEHGGRTVPASAPLPTVTTARGGAMGVAYLVLEYYGTGQARPVTEPLPTVTCNDRFGLVEASGNQIGFRMLQPHELAAAQGFPADYRFTGTKSDQVRQIGNAVPCGFATAIVAAQLTQTSDVRHIITAPSDSVPGYRLGYREITPQPALNRTQPPSVN
jgi:DNA (cytosine-5)-methyltransferase 1